MLRLKKMNHNVLTYEEDSVLLDWYEEQGCPLRLLLDPRIHSNYVNSAADDDAAAADDDADADDAADTADVTDADDDADLAADAVDAAADSYAADDADDEIETY